MQEKMQIKWFNKAELEMYKLIYRSIKKAFENYFLYI